MNMKKTGKVLVLLGASAALKRADDGGISVL